MRPFEALLVFTVVAGLALALFARPDRARWRFIGVVAFLVAIGLLIVEGYRWQMVPAFVLGLLFVLCAIWGWAPQPATAVWRGSWPRKLLGLAVLGVAFLAVVVAVALPVLLPVFRFPRPGGPHALGTTSLHLVDEDRPETFTDDESDHRQLMVRVWYPAADDSEGAVDAYWEDAALKVDGLAAMMQAPPFVFGHLEHVRTNSRSQAALAESVTPFPVLLFSHGYGGTATQSTGLMEELASRGYVIFSVAHPYEALPIEFPDGSVAHTKLVQPEDPQARQAEMAPLIEELHANWKSGQGSNGTLLKITAEMGLDASFEIWVDDMACALDEIERIATGTGPFAGRLDLDRIGAFGHSFGGAASIELCAREPRCRAAVNLDGIQFGSVVESGCPRPIMLVYSGAAPWMNHSVFAGSAGPAYQLFIAGSQHMDFSDLAQFSPLLQWTASDAPAAPFGAIDPRRMREITAAYVGAFFDQHLLGRESPLLDGASEQFPEVTIETKPAPVDNAAAR